tara:strand:- start:95 stop:346 length:252 start_codon:yes stop_codon:yes gene_type:complete
VPAVVVLEINVPGLVQKEQVRVGCDSEVERAVNTCRSGDVQNVALDERHRPVDILLIRSDRDSQRIGPGRLNRPDETDQISES